MAVPFDRSATLARLREQQAWYAAGHTRPLRARREALQALATLLTAQEGALLEALHRDMRKPAFEAYLSEVGLVRAEVRHALAHLREWAAPRRVPTPLALQPATSRIYPGPLGTVLIIAPWNYPLQLLLSPLVGAIAAGNCAVLKPSEEAPHTAALLERLLAETLPAGWVVTVQGPGQEVVPALLSDHRFDHVFFTGSPRVGTLVAEMAARKLVPVTLELGGKSPAIVDRSANVEQAAKRIAWGKFFNAGQTCVAPDHVLVHADVHDRFVQALTRQVKSFFGDDPQHSPDLARIVNDRRFEVLRAYLAHGTVQCGGQHDAADRYIAPTVLTDVPADAPVMREEIFGPVLPVLRWQRPEEVLAMVGKNPFPLACYIFSKDRRQQRFFRERIIFGGGCTDHVLLHFGSVELPVGGVGTSGMGRYHGRATFELFSHHKSMVHAGTRLDPAIQYPPYSNWKQRLVRLFLR